MPFGLSPSLKEFQRLFDNALEGLDDVAPICDDCLVFGETHSEAVADHDRKLRVLLERCRAKGITLNKKMKHCHLEVSVMGHMVS